MGRSRPAPQARAPLLPTTPRGVTRIPNGPRGARKITKGFGRPGRQAVQIPFSNGHRRMTAAPKPNHARPHANPRPRSSSGFWESGQQRDSQINYGLPRQTHPVGVRATRREPVPPVKPLWSLAGRQAGRRSMAAIGAQRRQLPLHSAWVRGHRELKPGFDSAASSRLLGRNVSAD